MTFISMCEDVVTKFKVAAKDCLDKSVGGTNVLNVFLVKETSYQNVVVFNYLSTLQARRQTPPTPVPAGPTPALMRL